MEYRAASRSKASVIGYVGNSKGKYLFKISDIKQFNIISMDSNF
jgi:hypothetical protein